MSKSKQDQSPQGAPPRWERRKDDRPKEILDAALEVFAQKGFSAARLEDVASRAGVTKGTLYLYFADKEDIFRQVIEQEVVPNIDAFEAMMQQTHLPAEQQLRNVVTRMAILVGTTNIGVIPKLVIAEAGNFPSIADFYRDRVIVRIQAVFAGILKRGVAEGAFREMDIDYASRILASPLFFLAIAKNLTPIDEVWNIDPERHARVALDMFLNGLLAPATNEPDKDEEREDV